MRQPEIAERAALDAEPGRTAPAPSRELPGVRIVPTAIVFTAVLGTWALAALADVGGRPLIAGPWATLLAFSQHGLTIGVDLAATFARAAVGLGLGAIAGLLLGAIVAAAARAAPAAEAMLDVARSIPPVVWLPIFLLGVGYNDVARVATIAAGVAVIMAVSVTTAARAPRSARHEVLALSGASWLTTLRWTQPWESLPALLVGVRVSASMAVVVATVTEMVAGAPRGIGARIVNAQIAGETPQLTACIVAVGLAGWALTLVLKGAERAARRWSR